MAFLSFEFLAFFTSVLILNWLLKKWPLWWRLFLLTASYLFYSFWDIRFLAILIIVSFANFLVALLLGNQFVKQRRLILGGGVALNLAALGFFKYYDFFRLSFESFFQRLGIPWSLPFLDIFLPIGISFYIFRAISYLIDVYRKKIAAEKSWLDFFIYLAFFPHLLSGPIMRAGDFLPQLKNSGAKKIENFYSHFTLIFSGFLKKLVLASFLSASLVDNVFAVPENHSSLAIFLAILAYSLVLYFDFSGYSDLAIGFSGLLGFNSCLNFDTPYLSLNLRDFWRRWHISFSSWIRDYIYIPLGGSRVSKARKHFNLILAMVLAGLWHGPALHFIFWGFWHGLGLSATHFFHDRKGKETGQADSGERGKSWPGILKKFFAWLCTFSFVSLGWVFFKSETAADGWKVLRGLVNFRYIFEPLPLYVLLAVIFGFLFLFLEKPGLKFFTRQQEKMPFILWLILALSAMLVLFKLGPDTIPPFIYFGF